MDRLSWQFQSKWKTLWRIGEEHNVQSREGASGKAEGLRSKWAWPFRKSSKALACTHSLPIFAYRTAGQLQKAPPTKRLNNHKFAHWLNRTRCDVDQIGEYIYLCHRNIRKRDPETRPMHIDGECRNWTWNTSGVFTSRHCAQCHVGERKNFEISHYWPPLVHFPIFIRVPSQRLV